MPNTTVEEVTKNGFLEEWTYNIFYSAFFSQCQPLKCTYVTSQRKSIMQVITILLGLYGGLTLILGFIIRRLIHTFNQESIASRRQNNIVDPL